MSSDTHGATLPRKRHLGVFEGEGLARHKNALPDTGSAAKDACSLGAVILAVVGMYLVIASGAVVFL